MKNIISVIALLTSLSSLASGSATIKMKAEDLDMNVVLQAESETTGKVFLDTCEGIYRIRENLFSTTVSMDFFTSGECNQLSMDITMDEDDEAAFFAGSETNISFRAVKFDLVKRVGTAQMLNHR